MTQKLRIGFMGTPDFALEALKAIHGAGHDVVCVYSQPPRPKGRGHKLASSPVHAYADENAVPVFHPKSLKSEEAQEQFAAHNIDIAIVAAYGLILPKAVLAAPKYGCINIHASLLPRWRGASPIHRAVWSGDAQSGVTLMQMDEGLDTGPEIMKTAIDLAPDETVTTLHDRLAALGAEMTIKALHELAENGQLSVEEQQKDGVTYASLLKREDGKLNWEEDAEKIDCQIRALNPWPGTWTETDGQRLKILQARPVMPGNFENNAAEKNQPVGIIINKQGHIQCGGGSILKLTRVQPPGKQAMDFSSALNGGYVKIGQSLA